MKKIVFGSIMMLAGVHASALLMAGPIISYGNGDGLQFLRILSAYDLDNVLYIFVAMSIIGLLIAISEFIKTEK